jgi:hypothetical protein
MGTIEAPHFAIHTSYGLVWQKTVAPGAPPALWLPLLSQMEPK